MPRVALIISWCYTLAYVSFLFLRSTEVLALASRSPLYQLLLLGGFLSLVLQFLPPRKDSFNGIKGKTWVGKWIVLPLILFQLKTELDSQFMKGYSLASHKAPVYAKFLNGYVAVVTGANSGTGYAISEQLSMLGATVVMACRSKDKCESAAASIRNSVFQVRSSHGMVGGPVQTVVLDLGDLVSVRSFAKTFKREHKHLDFLVLNAGAVSPPGTRTVQGLEDCLGSMHVGHAALTRWLREPLLRRRSGDKSTAARVVYVGSQAYMAGRFDVSLLQGDGRGDLHGEVTDNCGGFGPLGLLPCCPIARCPMTNGYARAKLASVLHTHELQRRHDEAAGQTWWHHPRRLVAVNLHPGAVHTNIHPFFSTPVMAFVMRSAEEASRLIVHALLSDSFVPSAFLDAMGRAHDLQGFRELHMRAHLEAFPEAAKLQFTVPNSIKIPSFDLWNWDQAVLVASNSSTAINATKSDVAARLWDVTEKVIADFERKGKL